MTERRGWTEEELPILGVRYDSRQDARNPPQLYMRLRTFLTDSLSRTLSEVTGQIPPLARVAAITDMLSVVISREHSWK